MSSAGIKYYISIEWAFNEEYKIQKPNNVKVLP